MTILSNNNLSAEFENILDDDEEIIWIERPQFIPFILSESWFGAPFFLVGCIFSGSLTDALSNGIAGFIFGFLWGYMFLIVGLSFLVQNLLNFPNTVYAYSTKRIMLRKGFIGTSFTIIDYDKIKEIKLDLDFFLTKYNVGTIKFYTGKTPKNHRIVTVFGKLYYDENIRWSAIPNYEQVLKKVKEISLSIKTDFNYPNELRPDTNPGLHTSYDSKE
jgi:hypothetical protein